MKSVFAFLQQALFINKSPGNMKRTFLLNEMENQNVNLGRINNSHTKSNLFCQLLANNNYEKFLVYVNLLFMPAVFVMINIV